MDFAFSFLHILLQPVKFNIPSKESNWMQTDQSPSSKLLLDRCARTKVKEHGERPAWKNHSSLVLGRVANKPIVVCYPFQKITLYLCFGVLVSFLPHKMLPSFNFAQFWPQNVKHLHAPPPPRPTPISAQPHLCASELDTEHILQDLQYTIRNYWNGELQNKVNIITM